MVEKRKFKNIIIDLGHGGVDRQGNYITAPFKMHTFENGDEVYEGELNRQVGLLLYPMLKLKFPFLNVIFTVNPWDSRDLSLKYRVSVANKYNPEDTLFLSIHHNSSPNHNAGGFEIYTSVGHTYSDIIADSIADEIEPIIENVSRKLRYDFTDLDKDKESDFYVLRKTRCPAVLIELGFFDYKPDLDIISKFEYQLQEAMAIVKGIEKFL